jgi:hypothetical protein
VHLSAEARYHGFEALAPRLEHRPDLCGLRFVERERVHQPLHPARAEARTLGGGQRLRGLLALGQELAGEDAAAEPDGECQGGEHHDQEDRSS